MPTDIILKDKTLEIVGDKVSFRREGASSSKPTVLVDAVNGNLEVGKNGADGDILIYGKTNKRTIEISAEKNKNLDDRTIYINGQDPSIEVKHFRKRASGVFPKLRVTPTSIECKTDRGLPKFKLTERGSVFTTQLSVAMGSLITMARDITIRAKAPGGSNTTVNVHSDITALKAQVIELQKKVALLERRR